MKLKKLLAMMVCAATTFSLIGCGGGGGQSSGGAASSGDTKLDLKLAHNLAEDHAVHIELSSFVEEVAKESGGSVNISVLPNGILGSESDMLAQIQNGALDMAKVSASTLGNFSKQYNAYSVPYVFDDKEHYYAVMDGEITQSIFDSTASDGFIGLTWLDSGSRSFYTVDRAIRKPEDLRGLKIRTMDSQMAISMMNALGGSATVMGYSDIYTGLQSGVIDGAENNVTALRDHGEVAHYYSFDEHTRIPDVIVISSKVWDKMSESQKKTVKSCAQAATNNYKTAWAEFEESVLKLATETYGVELVRDVDIPSFQAAVQPVYEDLKTSDPEVYKVVEQIRGAAN